MSFNKELFQTVGLRRTTIKQVKVLAKLMAKAKRMVKPLSMVETINQAIQEAMERYQG